MKPLSFLALSIVTTGLIAGCAGKGDSAPEYTGVEVSPTPYQIDSRIYSTSWGHSGRGGAALRKPTYQHVLGDISLLDTQTGRLYPSLQAAESSQTALTGMTGNEGSPDVQVYPLGDGQPTAFGQRGEIGFSQISDKMQECATALEHPDDIRVLISARVQHTDYIRVRNKLCTGAERLTYNEWQILVNGTPKDLPMQIQATPAVNQH